MSYVPNNNCLFNAAVSGYYAAILSGRGILNPNTDYTTFFAGPALAFAQAVDTLIPTNDSISASSPPHTTLFPSGEGAPGQQAAQLAYPDGLKVICIAVLGQGGIAGTTADDFADIAATIVAIFQSLSTAISATIP